MMTKEELEKEAEQYSVENWEHYEEGQTDYKALKQAYLDSAEPREKRIAELERQLSAMEKGTCDVCKVKDAEFYEKRIAELEAQIEKMKNCKNCANYMISGKCPCLFRTGWCKNWELAK